MQSKRKLICSPSEQDKKKTPAPGRVDEEREWGKTTIATNKQSLLGRQIGNFLGFIATGFKTGSSIQMLLRKHSFNVLFPSAAFLLAVSQSNI